MFLLVGMSTTWNFDTCANQQEAARMYRASDIYTVDYDEEAIMQEIYRWGPVSAGMTVFSDFIDEFEGIEIYMGPKKDSKGKLLEDSVGGHAVRIVGWGEENNTPYWWIANSWGPRYGIQGYFRMKRMIPECQLEKNVVALKPQFPGRPTWNSNLRLEQQISEALRNTPDHKQNSVLFYYNHTIQEIQEGKLKGDLNPVIQTNELPGQGDFTNFWVADLITHANPNLLVNIAPTNKRSLYVILIFIIGSLLILISPIE